MRLRVGFLLAALLTTAPAARAASVTIDFESFAEFDEPGTMSTVLGDVQFVGATVLTGFNASGGFGNLNDDDFPPRSGTNVVSNLLVDLNAGAVVYGPLSLNFENPLYSFLGYFTYNAPLNLLFTLGNGTTTSVDRVGSNLGQDVSSGGALPNEEIRFESALGITGVVITLGSPVHQAYPDATFALDDLTLSNDFPGQSAPVPEPASLLLLGTGVAAAAARRRQQRSR